MASDTLPSYPEDGKGLTDRPSHLFRVPGLCAIDGCSGPDLIRGLCKRHYAQAYEKGEHKKFTGTRKRGGNRPALVKVIKCEGCGEEFRQGRTSQVFCSRQCIQSIKSEAKKQRLLARANGKALALCTEPECTEFAQIRGLCAMHYARGRKDGTVVRIAGRPIIACGHCGTEFKARRKTSKYCSERCYQRGVILPARKRNVRTCGTCGKVFLLRIGGKGRSGESNEGQFCSRSCHHEFRRSVAEAGTKMIVEIEHASFVRVDLLNLESRYNRDKHPSGARRRAIFYGVPFEDFDASTIFERDKWTCQICGRKTPSRLRGTVDGRSPELDHRIPMSKGGSHTPENVQCACKRCNRAKSNILVLGQTNMFHLFSPLISKT